MVEKAFASDADAVLLDLEDAVAPDAKAEARRNVTRILKELDRGEPHAPTGLRKERGSRA
jgi:malyl-CoA/(S)-citramalyl-CoA lyase